MRVLALAGCVDGLNQSHLWLGDTGLAEVSVQLPADRSVAAAQREHARIGAREEFESVIGRVAEQTVEVRVLDGQRTARLHRGPHPPQKINGVGQVLEKKSREDKVVGVGLVPGVDVGRPKLDVRDSAFHGGRPAEGELDLVQVDADHDAVRSRPPRIA
jgi:hypothetical protein